MADFNQVGTEEGTPFNMAMLFFVEVHETRTKKTAAMLDNDMGRVYDCLQELLTLAMAKIKKKEESVIKTSLKKAKYWFDKAEEKPEQRLESLKKCKDCLRDADRDLIRYMNKYHMIFPNIKTLGGLDSVRKQYMRGADGGKA